MGRGIRRRAQKGHWAPRSKGALGAAFQEALGAVARPLTMTMSRTQGC